MDMTRLTTMLIETPTTCAAGIRKPDDMCDGCHDLIHGKRRVQVDMSIEQYAFLTGLFGCTSPAEQDDDELFDFCTWETMNTFCADNSIYVPDVKPVGPVFSDVGFSLVASPAAVVDHRQR